MCAAHALTTEREEIMGLLLGNVQFVSGKHICYIWGSSIQTRSDRRYDRVEVAPEQLAETATEAEELGRRLGLKTRVIGWYHSHPHKTVLPSHVDLRTQHNYQQMESGFVGLIFACFLKSKNEGGCQRFQTMAFQTFDSHNPGLAYLDLATRAAEEAKANGSRFARLEIPLIVQPLASLFAQWNAEAGGTITDVREEAASNHCIINASKVQLNLFYEERNSYYRHLERLQAEGAKQMQKFIHSDQSGQVQAPLIEQHSTMSQIIKQENLFENGIPKPNFNHSLPKLHPSASLALPSATSSAVPPVVSDAISAEKDALRKKLIQVAPPFPNISLAHPLAVAHAEAVFKKAVTKIIECNFEPLLLFLEEAAADFTRRQAKNVGKLALPHPESANCSDPSINQKYIRTCYNSSRSTEQKGVAIVADDFPPSSLPSLHACRITVPDPTNLPYHLHEPNSSGQLSRESVIHVSTPTLTQPRGVHPQTERFAYPPEPQGVANNDNNNSNNSGSAAGTLPIFTVSLGSGYSVTATQASKCSILDSVPVILKQENKPTPQPQSRGNRRNLSKSSLDHPDLPTSPNASLSADPHLNRGSNSTTTTSTVNAHRSQTSPIPPPGSSCNGGSTSNTNNPSPKNNVSSSSPPHQSNNLQNGLNHLNNHPNNNSNNPNKLIILTGVPCKKRKVS